MVLAPQCSLIANENLLKVGALVGRKLFEGGHFSFASLSACQGMHLEEAEKLVSSEEARRTLPESFIWEVETFETLNQVNNALQNLHGQLCEFLSTAARTGLNAMDDYPSQSKLASSALRNLVHEPHLSSPSSNWAASAKFKELQENWNSGLSNFLTKFKPSPQDLCCFLLRAQREQLFYVAMGFSQHLNAISLSLLHYARGRLLTSQSSPIWSFRFKYNQIEQSLNLRETIFESLVQFQPAWLFKIQSMIMEDKIPPASQEMHDRLLQLNELYQLLHRQEKNVWLGKNAALSTAPSTASSTHLDLDESPATKENVTACANFCFVKALGRQLFAHGVEPKDCRHLEEKLFEYAGQHKSFVAEILDDEILRLAQNITQEQLAEAKLRVRLEDEEYPLSVSFRAKVVQLSGLSGLAQAET